LREALSLNREVNDPEGIAYSLRNLGQCALRAGKFAEAARLQQEALSIAQGNRYASLIVQLYKGLANAYAGLGQWQLAYRYEAQYSTLADSLFGAQRTQEIGRIQAQYEMEERMQEQEARQRAEAEAARERDNNQYLLIFAILCAIVLGILFAGRLHVPRRVADVLVFLTLMLVFEFLLVVLDPILDAYTGGVPLPKLGLNALLAVAFAFLHRFLEPRIKRRYEVKPHTPNAATHTPIQPASPEQPHPQEAQG
jgi:tetratricopeptide (TPR) repeat protein